MVEASHLRVPESSASTNSIFILDTGGGDPLAVNEALQHALRVPILVESKSLTLDSNRNALLLDESNSGVSGGGRFSLTTVLARIATEDAPGGPRSTDVMTVTYQTQSQSMMEQSDESGQFSNMFEHFAVATGSTVSTR